MDLIKSLNYRKEDIQNQIDDFYSKIDSINKEMSNLDSWGYYKDQSETVKNLLVTIRKNRIEDTQEKINLLIEELVTIDTVLKHYNTLNV